MIARIAVASAVFSMDKPFDYRIPDSLTLQPGQRVRVPFGASNRRTEGIVLAVMPDGAERPDGPALKPVEAGARPGAAALACCAASGGLCARALFLHIL